METLKDSFLYLVKQTNLKECFEKDHWKQKVEIKYQNLYGGTKKIVLGFFFIC